MRGPPQPGWVKKNRNRDLLRLPVGTPLKVCTPRLASFLAIPRQEDAALQNIARRLSTYLKLQKAKISHWKVNRIADLRTIADNAQAPCPSGASPRVVGSLSSTVCVERNGVTGG